MFACRALVRGPMAVADFVCPAVSEHRLSCAEETWDRDDRLTQVTLPAGLTNSFGYDANGLRVQKVESTGTSRYVLDGSPGADELDDAGSVRTSYLNVTDRSPA